MATYRTQFIANGGKVNETKFHKAYIEPIVPNYGLKAWYQFIEKFRKHASMSSGLAVAQVATSPVTTEEKKLETAMMSNEVATQLGIRAALNIGAKALQDIIDHPEDLVMMSKKDRAELLIKAMKAQDSRIHAIGKLKEDDREQQKFDRAFDSI